MLSWSNSLLTICIILFIRSVTTAYITQILTYKPLLTLYLLISYIILFSIKKCLKALIKRLKVKYTPSIVYNCLYNTISVVNVFKKQRINNKVF